MSELDFKGKRKFRNKRYTNMLLNLRSLPQLITKITQL
jgi:hypothetical protein